MKIDRRSKLWLACAGAAIAFIAYLGNITAPLGRERAALTRALAQSQQTVAAATQELAAFHQRDARIAAEAPMFAWATQLTNSIPQPYLVEIPLKLSRALRAEGIEGAQVHLAQLLPFPALPGFALAKWEVRVSRTRVFAFGEALAALENEIPLGQLKDLQIERKGAESDVRVALEFDTLVRP